MPPFKGPAGGPSRVSQPSASPDARKVPPPFIGARPASGARKAPNDEVEMAPAPALDLHQSPPPQPPTAETRSEPVEVGGASHDGERKTLRTMAEQPALQRDSAAENSSAPVELPWLDTSNATAPSAEAIPFPPFDRTPSEAAEPEEAAQALAGLPYFDGDGGAHKDGEPPTLRASGRMHRIESDPASVLERIAARVRTGELSVPSVDPLDGEAATLAAVLTALLRHRG